MLEDKPARQKPEHTAVELFASTVLNGIRKSPARLSGELLLVHLAGVQHFGGPGVAVARRKCGELRGFVIRRDAAGEQCIYESFTRRHFRR